MKKINLINIITYLFIVLALFIISCDPAGNGGDTPSGGDTATISACKATDRDTLESCIEAAMKEQGTTTTPNLNHITLGADITDLSGFFSRDNSPLNDNADFDITSFNGNISGWDVSNIGNFDNMFNGASTFKQDLSKWDLAGDTYTDMFTASAMDFNATNADTTSSFTEYEKYPIGYYATAPANKTALVAAIEKIMKGQQNADTPTLRIINTSSITDFSALFSNTSPLLTTTDFKAATFNADISGWNVSAGIGFSNMFNGAAAFTQDLGNWNVSKGTTFENMFNGASKFKQNLSKWDITKKNTN